MEDDLWWKMSLMETFDGRQALCELRKVWFYAHVPIYIIYHSNTRYTVSFILPSRNIAINGIPAYTNTIKKSVYTEIGPINPKHGGLKSLKNTVQSYILVGHNKKLGFICKTWITSFFQKGGKEATSESTLEPSWAITKLDEERDDIAATCPLFKNICISKKLLVTGIAGVCSPLLLCNVVL